MYVESRKMVQMNLLQSRNRDRRIDDHGRNEGWDQLGRQD